MVVIGNFRENAELRRKKRQSCRYSAAILTGNKNGALIACNISDISENGAKLIIEASRPLPPNFILLLTRNGRARRYCRLVWQDKTNAGVEFEAAATAER